MALPNILTLATVLKEPIIMLIHESARAFEYILHRFSEVLVHA